MKKLGLKVGYYYAVGFFDLNFFFVEQWFTDFGPDTIHG